MSSRVNDGNFNGRDLDAYRDFYIEAQRNGRYRIYENGDGYSQTTGGITKKGKAVRRYDPDAGEREGCIGEWSSVKDAENYIDRWLVPPPKPKRTERGPVELSNLFVLRPVPRREVPWSKRRGVLKRNRRPRDTQRERLYRAEREAFLAKGISSMADAPKDFATMLAIDEYVETVRTSKWLAVHYPRGAMAPVRLVGGRGCNATESRIMLAKWGYVKWIVLHELAHVVTDRHHRYEKLPGHGREFARVYLALVRRWMGVAEYEKLRREFKLHRVKYSVKKARAKTGHLPKGNPGALAAYREKRKAARVAAMRVVNIMDRAGIPPTAQAAVAGVMLDRLANG